MMKLASRSILLASAAFAAVPAAAQEVETPDQANSAPTDIIVTAQKREQTLLEVPQSIAVVGGERLEQIQATNFKDYLKFVPGLQLNQSTPGFGRLIIRGVNTGGVATTVGVYKDETIFGSSSGLVNGATLAGDFDTFDIERIEVLRGPQGTLYGANALGGVLKFVTRKPNMDRLEVRARASVETVSGGDESYLGSAVVNVPLGDTFAIRASGFYRDFGGFIDSIGTAGSDVEDDINTSKSYGGRASALFSPNENFSIQLGVYLQNLDVDAADSVDADPSRGTTRYGRLTQSQFAPERSEIRYRVYDGIINYDFGFASLVSVTSYSTLRQRFRADLTTAFGPLVAGALGIANDFFQTQTTRVHRFTQELRLQSPESETFDWILGGYYTRESGLIDQGFSAVTPGTLTPIPNLPLLGAATLPSRYREFAGFANATLHFGDRFDLTFGGRYSHNRQRADQSSDGILAGGPSVLPTARSSEGVFTYSVAPKIKFGEHVSVYARVAKGFRPGGPNVLPPAAPPELRSYDSDSLINYELGIKGETADRSFSIDAAIFHIDWKDIQVAGVINNFGLNFNAGKAQSDGFEFTATARPTRGLAFSFNGAYTHARLKDDTPPQVGGLSGDRLPYTPRFSMGANADYEWSLGAETEAYVGASLYAQSRRTAAYNAFRRATDGRQPTLAAYATVDVRAGLDFGQFTVELYGKNLTNSEGKTSLESGNPPGSPFNVPLGGGSAGVIRPRTFGVTLGAEF